MKGYKDGTLKYQILSYIFHNSGCTSQDLAEHIGHPNIKTLRSEVYYLRRYGGYISSDKSSIPHRLTLTKLGIKGAQDPHSVQIKRQERQERVQAMVMSILEDDEKFAEAVEAEVKIRLKEIDAGIRKRPIVETVESPADSALKEKLQAKDLRIQELQAQVQHLKLHKANVPTKVAPKEKTPEEQKQESERRLRREKLAMQYQRKYLDARFFSIWGDMLPYKMSHMQLYNIGSIEIMSKNNPEIRRGHTRRLLYPPEIIGAKFHIIKMSKNGILISGQGLPGGQVSLRW